MKMRNIILGIASLGMVLAIGVSASAHVSAANGDTPNCKFIYEEGQHKGFTTGTNEKGDTVSVNVIVEGDSNCHKDFVFASFEIPNAAGNPYPLENQKLFDFVQLPGAKPGTYKMTVNVPKCFYQVDLALGMKPTGTNGHLPIEPGRMLNAKLGGNGVCTTPTPPATPVTTQPTTTPTTLINTGAGNIAGLFAIVTVAAALSYRTVLVRRMR